MARLRKMQGNLEPSEPRTAQKSPGLSRPRKAKACQRCRTRKQRCEGPPACRNCASANEGQSFQTFPGVTSTYTLVSLVLLYHDLMQPLRGSPDRQVMRIGRPTPLNGMRKAAIVWLQSAKEGIEVMFTDWTAFICSVPVPRPSFQASTVHWTRTDSWQNVFPPNASAWRFTRFGTSNHSKHGSPIFSVKRYRRMVLCDTLVIPGLPMSFPTPKALGISWT